MGKSLRQISKLTGISLSTIQYHLKTGKSRIKRINLPNSDFIKGEIVGAFAGDGSYQLNKSGRGGNHLIKFYLSYRDDKIYANYISSVLKSMGLKVSVIIRKFDGVPSCIELRTRSLSLLKFIRSKLYWKGKKTYSVRLRKDVKNSDEFLFGFARGLMDTDGFVEDSNVAFGSVSNSLILDLRDIFKKLKISSRITTKKRNSPRKNLFLLRTKRKDLNLYLDNVGFSNLRKGIKSVEIINKSPSNRFINNI